jgi:hypothetical protein
MTGLEHAQLSLRRTGGLANVPMAATLDTRELEPGKAHEIISALDNVDLDHLSDSPGWPPGAADTFQYALEVHSSGGTRKATFSDRQVPAELAPVVHTLMGRAQPASR